MKPARHESPPPGALSLDSDPRSSGYAPVVPADEALDTLAHALAQTACAATDRISASVRALRPANDVDPAAIRALRTDVQTLHAAVEHLRALHVRDGAVRPAPELLDASAVAHDVAESLLLEGLAVQVVAPLGPVPLLGHAPALQRILRQVLERAGASDEAPWLRVQVLADERTVAFELPWLDDAPGPDDEERAWLEHAVREELGTFTVQGERARVTLPRTAAGSDDLSDGALAREIASLRAQRPPPSMHAAARTRADDLARAYEDLRREMDSLDFRVRQASFEAHHALVSVQGAAVLLAERDALGGDIQFGVQRALRAVEKLLRALCESSNDVAEPFDAPSREPAPVYALHPRALDDDDDTGDEGEAAIPLRPLR